MYIFLWGFVQFNPILTVQLVTSISCVANQRDNTYDTGLSWSSRDNLYCNAPCAWEPGMLMMSRLSCNENETSLDSIMLLVCGPYPSLYSLGGRITNSSDQLIDRFFS